MQNINYKIKRFMKTSRLLGFAFGAIAFGLLGCGEIENPTEPTPDPKPEEVKSDRKSVV